MQSPQRRRAAGRWRHELLQRQAERRERVADPPDPDVGQAREAVERPGLLRVELRHGLLEPSHLRLRLRVGFAHRRLDRRRVGHLGEAQGGAPVRRRQPDGGGGRERRRAVRPSLKRGPVTEIAPRLGGRLRGPRRKAGTLGRRGRSGASRRRGERRHGRRRSRIAADLFGEAIEDGLARFQGALAARQLNDAADDRILVHPRLLGLGHHARDLVAVGLETLLIGVLHLAVLGDQAGREPVPENQHQRHAGAPGEQHGEQREHADHGAGSDGDLKRLFRLCVRRRRCAQLEAAPARGRFPFCVPRLWRPRFREPAGRRRRRGRVGCLRRRGLTGRSRSVRSRVRFGDFREIQLGRSFLSRAPRRTFGPEGHRTARKRRRRASQALSRRGVKSQ